MIRHPRYPNGPPPPMSGVIAICPRPRSKDGSPLNSLDTYPYTLQRPRTAGTGHAGPSIPPPSITVHPTQGAGNGPIKRFSKARSVYTEYIDREVEVPVTKFVEKIINIPVVQKTVEKPVVKTVQKFVEVPQIEYVDRYVDVPVVKYVEVVQEVKVPQVVRKYVEKIVEYTPPESPRSGSVDKDSDEDDTVVAAG